MTINKFRGKNSFLSNFWPVYIRMGGHLYNSVEHAYQASKTLDEDERRWFRGPKSGAQAKFLGRQVTLRPDWDRKRLQIMKDLVSQKFENPKLRQQLLDTGDQELIEGNTWGDTYWGVCRGQGLNMLGKILMEVRDDITSGKCTSGS